MARYTFGGRFEQVGVTYATDMVLKLAPGQTMPALYDGPLSDGGRVQTTDFLLDPNDDGTFDTAASSIVVDDLGIPPYFQGPDNISVLYDLLGHALYANDAGGGGGAVSAASESVAGIAEVSSNTEADTGTNNTTMMSPVKVKRLVDAHNASTTSHQTLRDQVDSNTTQIASKASLVSGVVPIASLPASTGATPGTLVTREDVTAAIQVGQGTADNHAMQRVQILAAIADGAGLADVQDLVATGLPLSATGTGTWVTIPGMAITNAVSGQKYKVSLQLVVRSTATAGFKVRSKIGTATVTSVLTNPSFVTDTVPWTVNSTHTLSRDTVAGGQDGSANLKLTCVSTVTALVFSERHPALPGDVWTAAGYAKLGAGTGKNTRVDLEYEDSAGATLGTRNGSTIVPTTGAWTRSVVSSTTVAPAGTATVRARCAYVTPVGGDTVHFDAIQLEPFAPVPAYGNTGSSGANALDIRGFWRGLTLTAPTAENYSRVTPIRYASGSGGLETLHGALGASTDSIVTAEFEDITVTGSGLTNQRIEFEFADRVADGANHAEIVAASGTFARVT